MHQLISQIACEFIGTFILVATVGVNVVTETGIYNVTSITTVLMVMIYSLGGVSGAHLNPAVTVACAVAGKLSSPMQGLAYVAAQIFGGMIAGLMTYLLNGSYPGPIKPGADHNAVQALATEFLYTFMLAFVVLNVACYSKAAGNHYYGLAIAFVVSAGGYAGGPVSGGAFNPAVAIGIGPLNEFNQWSLIYALIEVVAGAAAAGMFLFMRRDDVVDPSWQPTMVVKLTSEFLGTFFLCLTVGLNVMANGQSGAWSIAASLTSLIYALGSSSGAHFNPAVTLAILLSGRSLISPVNAALYVVVQFVGGICGVLTALSLATANLVLGHLGPDPQALNKFGQPTTVMDACDEETIFTFVLCFVVLCVATSKHTGTSEMFGFAIGSCVIAGGVASSKVSGGCLNPAVSFGLEVTNGVWHAMKGHASPFLIAPVAGYVGFEFLGGIIAAIVFRVTHMAEYSTAANVDEKKLLEEGSQDEKTQLL